MRRRRARPNGVAMALLLGACATAPRSTETQGSFARAYSDALEARDVELPAHARTAADIRLIAKAREAIVACAAGKSPRFSDAWLQAHGAEPIAVQEQTSTVGALAKDCAAMLDVLDHREVKACGARYVRLERWASGPTRVVQTSTGWYMTPCETTRTARRAAKEADVVRAACQSPSAGVYLVTKWKQTAAGETATAACILPDASRSDWLPGNPGLGIK